MSGVRRGPASQKGRMNASHRLDSLAIVLSLAVAILTAWAAPAIWYRLPAAELGRVVACGLFVLLGLAAIIALFSRFRIRAFVLFFAVFAAVLFWWSTIKPLGDADWAPDVARQVTGTRDGNLLTLKDVRDFEWRSQTDFTPRWTTRTYDLSGVQTADLFMSYWSGTKIAHVIMSFGFAGGDYLAWSIEVRRRSGGAFSPWRTCSRAIPWSSSLPTSETWSASGRMFAERTSKSIA